MRDLRVGMVFAGHRLEAVLGRGGMGVVYLAMHERLKRRRALKVISPAMSSDAQFRHRFERESELAASIEHPHVIPIYDAGEDDGQLYIAMRHVDGTDMHQLIQERGALDMRLTSLIATQVASALDAAHARSLVHRDVKPANVLIEGDGAGSHSYLSDFGLTKAVDRDTSRLTASDAIIGTLDYIAPEQLTGAASPASDVYALGCLVFHALSGEVPYPNRPIPAKIWAHLNAPPPPVARGPADVSEVVTRAMAKDPADRYARAGDFARALAEVVGAAPAATTTSPGRARTSAPPPSDTAAHSGDGPALGGGWRVRPKRRVVYAGGLVATLVIGVALFTILSTGGEPARHAGTDLSQRPRPTPPQRTSTSPEVANIKRIVLEYGRTRSSKRTCSLETDRKKRQKFRNPSKCNYRHGGVIVHYRILSVDVHGRRATAHVTGRFGIEKIYLAKSPTRGWLVDRYLRVDVEHIKRVILEYGRTSSSKRTCSLETDRKKRQKFGDPSKCHYPGGGDIVDYGIQAVAVRGRRGTVQVVTTRFGSETIYVVKSPTKGWLIDRVVHRAR